MLVEKDFTSVPYRYNHILIHWDAVSEDYDYKLVDGLFECVKEETK